jgi:MoaA/NifB/PqqE/SkfB family radical SAM enzyme
MTDDESGPTGAQKVLQLHPTRRCNLRCLHCYSASGPDVSETLELPLLKDAISDAANEGYNVAGISGGEPLLYPSLAELLSHARGCGFRTTVTTNGMLLDARRLEPLGECLDLLAISLDGIPAAHNRIRGSKHAFERMAGRLHAVRESGIPFGFIFTLTQHNLHELSWVMEFAHQEGAGLLQIHPLEVAGRAEQCLPRSAPDPLEMAVAYVQALRLQGRVGERVRVQVDLADAEMLREEPDRVFAGTGDSDRHSEDAPLAQLLSPLVVQSDGIVVPFQYGFARRFALGDLHRNRLSELAHRWRRERYPALRHLCRRAFDRLTQSDGAPIVNWYQAIATEARA